MTTLLRRWCSCVLLLLLIPASVAHAQTTKFITLGADLSAEQRTALLMRFGAVDGTDTILTVTRDEQIAAMQNIIPLDPTFAAISSSALTCAASGSGLRVSTENISLVTPAMYSGALLTAGIADAQLLVAAPSGATADGLTALTGIFRVFDNGACGRAAVDPLRQELATRWLATAANLGAALGDYNAAGRVLLSAQQQLLVGGQGDPAAVEPAFNNAQTDTGVVVPDAQRGAVLDLLLRLAEARLDWGAYGAGWALQDVSPTEAIVVPSGGAQPPRTISGTVRTPSTPTSSLTINVNGQQGQLNLRADAVTITRDNLPVPITALQAGDTVMMELGAGDAVTRITALSPEAVQAGASGMPLGRFVVGTVVAKDEGGLILARDGSGGPVRYAIPASAAIKRAGQTASLNDVAVEDNVVLFLGVEDAVEAVYANATGEFIVDGTVALTAPDQRLLKILIGNRPVNVTVPEGDPPIRLNSRATTLENIKAGDTISVTLSASGQVAKIDALRAASPTNWSRYLLWLIPLLILLLLLLFLFGRGRQSMQTLLVLPGGRRRIIDDEELDDIEQQAAAPPRRLRRRRPIEEDDLLPDDDDQ